MAVAVAVIVAVTMSVTVSVSVSVSMSVTMTVRIVEAAASAQRRPAESHPDCCHHQAAHHAEPRQHGLAGETSPMR